VNTTRVRKQEILKNKLPGLTLPLLFWQRCTTANAKASADTHITPLTEYFLLGPIVDKVQYALWCTATPIVDKVQYSLQLLGLLWPKQKQNLLPAGRYLPCDMRIEMQRPCQSSSLLL
jgi:hypothetical protein